MNTDRDVTRIVRSWLQEGSDGLPDRVLDATLLHVPATPQRRATWPAWRVLPMHTPRVAAAAAAVLVAGIVGVNLLSQGPGSAASSPPAAAASSQTAASSPSRSVRPSPAPTVRPGGALSPGSYVVDGAFPVRVTIPVTDDWHVWGPITKDAIPLYQGSPDPPQGRGIVVAVIENLFADPCDSSKGGLVPQVGPSVDDLAVGLAAQPDTDDTAPVDVELGGYSGKFLSYSLTRSDGPCTSLERWGSASGTRMAILGEHDEVWILDVDGVRVIIDAYYFDGTTDAQLAELREVVQGIRIEP